MFSPEQFAQYIEIEQGKLSALQRIAMLLERIAPTDQKAPGWVKPLTDFLHFDWDSIGATVTSVDDSGASIVEWNGKQFVRRSPNNKFGEAIWFSRSTGEKDSEGKTVYERLVTFKESDVEPIPAKISRTIETTSRPRTVSQQTATPADLKADTKEDLSHLIALSDFHLARIGWGKEQGRKYLEDTYNKVSRQQLTDNELEDFVERLSKLPADIPSNPQNAIR